MEAYKRTIVLGASPNPERYAYKAVEFLVNHGHPVIPLGIKTGSIGSIPIETEKIIYSGVHTISIYLNPEHQKLWYPYILSIQPRRILFNPGAENPELVQLARNHGIEILEACTLVLLNTHQY